MKARGEVRRLLIIIGELQSLIGCAKSNHENDRDPMSYENGQKQLREAFELCISATSKYEPIVIRGIKK
jgi:hypothetical protein